MRRARGRSMGARLAKSLQARPGGPVLEDGSRVAVVGGGPAGSFFSYFLQRMAASIDLRVEIVLYEPRFFDAPGPAGCNHCGGIVSESLVQLLATEGINLPPEIVQRGIDSYVVHMDVGSVRIDTPVQEKRIAALYRGNGPRQAEPSALAGLDRYLQDLAVHTGTRLRRQLVEAIVRDGDRPVVVCPDGTREAYDLVAVAAGVNSRLGEAIATASPPRRRPGKAKTYICEFRLGRDAVERSLGSSMHVFVLRLERLEFAALIPKGDFVTLCLLGDDVDEALVASFLSAPQVRACFPQGRVPQHVCHCFPHINVRAAAPPYGERLVFIGDSGVARLYKDGIGSAYRTAKAAARTAVFHGVSAEAFRRHFNPACHAIDVDNVLGRMVFASSGLLQRWRFTRRALLRMTSLEQRRARGPRRMSSVLWDVFTGSAPYREVLARSFHPAFLGSLAWNVLATVTMPAAAGERMGRTA